MNYTEYVERLDKNLKSNAVIKENDCVFHDIRLEDEFDIYGLVDPKNTNEFHRVPLSVCDAIGAGMQYFGRNTAGGRVRFSTNSKYVAIRVKMPEIHLRNMNYAGSAGFDLYIDSEKDSKFYKMFIPPFEFNGEWQGIIHLPGGRKQRNLTINFPLYNLVEKVEIGLQKSATLGHGKEYTYKKPIVFYGGSHVQGASANKPGNAASHFVSRYFDADFVNLGFSGNALGEKIMAEFIGSIDASLLIMEYDHNAPDADHLRATHYQFYKTVRTLRPDMPIIMTSKHDYYICSYYVKSQKENVERRKVVIESYERAKAEGDKNVYFIDGKDLLKGPNREDTTVDGVHPNDLGFYRMADKFIKFINKNNLLK
ncbi:MAG: hypothetical protein E7612_06340 [Ruminococcaceae bacterium]|nr:hypothetical protein [Oscillospiraceae bacterium]